MGIDVHPFATGRELWVGCVRIDHPKGLAGHSDADVLVHAVTDAVLGALGRRDIGFHYPPGDPAWEGYPGWRFLADMRRLMQEAGYELVNLDSVIVAERPRFSPHIPRMVELVAEHLGVDPGRVGIKATTSERMGFTGREEGVFAQAVVLLQRGAPPVYGGTGSLLPSGAVR